MIYLFYLNSQMMPVRNMPCSYGNHQTWWYVQIELGHALFSIQLSEKDWSLFTYSEGFSGGASGKEPTCQCRKHKRNRFNPLVRKIPWKRKWQPTPAFLPGKFHGQRSLVGYGPWGCKKSDTTKNDLAYMLLTQNLGNMNICIKKGFIEERVIKELERRTTLKS